MFCNPSVGWLQFFWAGLDQPTRHLADFATWGIGLGLGACRHLAVRRHLADLQWRQLWTLTLADEGHATPARASDAPPTPARASDASPQPPPVPGGPSTTPASAWWPVHNPRQCVATLGGTLRSELEKPTS